MLKCSGDAKSVIAKEGFYNKQSALRPDDVSNNNITL